MKIDVPKLVISIIVCQLAGAIGSFFTAPSISTWYATLEKPFFTPPDWAFAPVWITLYLLMGISAYMVWNKGLGKREARVAMAAFGVQLVLNSFWSVAFFGMRSPLMGLIVIAALWIAILATITKFMRISRKAGLLLLPYILWVSLAAILNLSIVMLNPS